MPEIKKDTNQTTSRQESGFGMLFRIFWMTIGNIIPLILLITIYESANNAIGIKDFFYWLAVLLLIIVRYADIKYLGGLTAAGLPASISNWRRYAVVLIICAAIIWGLVHAAKYIFS